MASGDAVAKSQPRSGRSAIGSHQADALESARIRAGRLWLSAEEQKFVRAAVIRWPYKAVIDLTGSPSRLFDLSDDPGERINLGAKYPGLMASLRSAATRQAAARPRRAAPNAVALDNGTCERLRALGYLEEDRMGFRFCALRRAI